MFLETRTTVLEQFTGLCGRQTLELVRRETSEFIAPDMWPPNNPDITAVDYCIWGVMQELV